MGKPITQTEPSGAGSETENELEDLIGYNLKRAYVHIQNDFRKALGNDGFAPRVFAALALVIQNPNISQSELSRMLGIERSGLVAIVDYLEKRGLMKRTKVDGDRRVHALVTTQMGTEVFNNAMSAVKAHEEQIFEMYSAREKAQLLSLLRKFRTAIEGEY